MKSIGIITIHRIHNYGSALQAYALQHYIQKNCSANAEIIDYIFPNEFHKTPVHYSLVKKIRIELGKLKDILKGKTGRIDRRFNKFKDDFLVLSERSYGSVDEINSNPPVYEIYMTGSDQVWNYKTLKNDPVMYLQFAPKDKPRVAFGASFAQKDVPSEYYPLLRNYLDSYRSIGVREQNSIEIIKRMGVSPTIPLTMTCDPTMLLDSSEYDEIAERSEIKPTGKYILCYFLDYAFNPEPALTKVLEQIQHKLNIPIIMLGQRKSNFTGEIKVINDIGPCEFAYLMKHAEYVLTSSFHGLMFSLINRKPFTAIIPDPQSGDCRIKDMLDYLKMSKCYIQADNSNPKIFEGKVYDDEAENSIKSLITSSQKYLKEICK